MDISDISGPSRNALSCTTSAVSGLKSLARRFGEKIFALTTITAKKTRTTAANATPMPVITLLEADWSMSSGALLTSMIGTAIVVDAVRVLFHVEGVGGGVGGTGGTLATDADAVVVVDLVRGRIGSARVAV